MACGGKHGVIRPGALVYAIKNAVSVIVSGLGVSAAALAWFGLVRIVRAAVTGIDETVSVRVHFALIGDGVVIAVLTGRVNGRDLALIRDVIRVAVKALPARWKALPETIKVAVILDAVGVAVSEVDYAAVLALRRSALGYPVQFNALGGRETR